MNLGCEGILKSVWHDLSMIHWPFICWGRCIICWLFESGIKTSAWYTYKWIEHILNNYIIFKVSAKCSVQLSFNKPVLDVPKVSFILDAKLRQCSLDMGFGGGWRCRNASKKLISELSHFEPTDLKYWNNNTNWKTVTHGYVNLIRFF